MHLWVAMVVPWFQLGYSEFLCYYVGRVHPPPLSRPLSEHNMNHLLEFERDKVQCKFLTRTTSGTGVGLINPFQID
jgi:hypothetical protein